jgi:hypothetical protein
MSVQMMVEILLFVSSIRAPNPELVRRWDQVGVASRYYDDRGKRSGGGMACLWGHPDGQHVDPNLHFVAHRDLPCGTVVHVYNPRTGSSTLAVVLDRGPYGAVRHHRWVMKIRKSDPGRWRGVVDLSPGTANAIGHNGFERVKIRRVEVPFDLTAP